MNPAATPTGVESITDLQRFLIETTPTIPVWQFLPALIMTALLCWLLGMFYQQFGRSLSNRASLARNFLMIGMTTMLVISIVKASLALSLGLVGALSIVRFRTAIKEPEELAYLFLTIGIGLGMGANQWQVTLTSYAVILGVLWLRARRATAAADTGSHLYLTVQERGEKRAALSSITAALSAHCSELDLRRFDEGADGLEVSYRIAFADHLALEKAREAIRALSPSMSLSFVDQDGLL
jgi:uncharacterized membrane protein YhiD involved in acid resistance